MVGHQLDTFTHADAQETHSHSCESSLISMCTYSVKNVVACRQIYKIPNVIVYNLLKTLWVTFHTKNSIRSTPAS